MKRKTICLLVVLVSLNMMVFLPGLSAAPYYEGKRITLIVGLGPGGGYDRMARLIAKHLPKYIPGKPVIVVENMEGAVSIIAANTVYNRAKPDGLTLVTFERGVITAQLLKAEGVKFDATKFSWVGSAAVEASVLCILSELPYKTFNDVLKAKEPINLASTGPASLGNQIPILLREFAGLKFNMVNYPSSADCMLAMERKEVDGQAGSLSSLKPAIDRGFLRPVLRGKVSQPEIASLPVDEDLTTDPIGKTLMSMRSATDLIGRPFAAPPGTPAEVMSILREAFAKVTKDPELNEEAKKLRMTAEYVPAEECLKVVNYVLNQPENIVREFGKYIKF